MASMADCVFCRIASGEIPSTLLYQDEFAVAFRDLNPQAATHVLVIPREHVASVAGAQPSDERLLGHLLLVAADIARTDGVDQSGYRIVVNHGADAGQTVFHLHVHLLGGRRMSWPPG
jgi:histidine triad (HIT) family protein